MANRYRLPIKALGADPGEVRLLLVRPMTLVTALLKHGLNLADEGDLGRRFLCED